MRRRASHHCTAAIFLQSYDTSVLPGHAKSWESAVSGFKCAVCYIFTVVIVRTAAANTSSAVILPFVTTERELRDVQMKRYSGRKLHFPAHIARSQASFRQREEEEEDEEEVPLWSHFPGPEVSWRKFHLSNGLLGANQPN